MASIFRYPGGKGKIKDIILNYCKPHVIGRCYVEPFFGGGSIGLEVVRKLGIKRMWINDIDIGLACFWHSLINYPESLINKINKFTPTVSKFYLYKECLLNLDAFPDEESLILMYGFRKLVVHQTSYSGLGTRSGGPLGGKDQSSKYKVDCRWVPSTLEKKINKAHKELSSVSIKNNTCTSYSYYDVLMSSTNSFFYLDPPYYNKGASMYQHSFTEFDHALLSSILKYVDQPWVLSYDDCPYIRNLYKWAGVDTVPVNYTVRLPQDGAVAKDNPNIKYECIIYPKSMRE